MEETNGYAKASNGTHNVNGKLNGKLNGKMNGKVNGKMNGLTGHAAVAKRKRSPVQKSSAFARIFNIAARLLTWYSIITVLLRCPATLEECNETTPKICKPYFQLKHVVSPHITPYYDAYAAPYVEKARPYYNTVDQTVFVPTRAYAAKYGAPRVQQAQAYGKAQWDKNIQPQLAVYQKLALAQYDQSLAPHVSRVSGTLSPYYDIARTNALQTYHELLLPSYEFLQPYAAHTYGVASSFTTDTALPSTYWAWNKTYVFLDNTVWPQVRVVYLENVEPQLARIGQRLGRYKEKSKTVLDAAPESTVAVKSSSFAKPTPSTASSSTATIKSTTAVESTPIPDASSIPETDKTTEQDTNGPIVITPAEGETEERKSVREVIAEDLELWQTKFTKAADEGAAEMEERIGEISKRMIERNINTMGRSLVSQLQDTAKEEVDVLQKEIVAIVKRSTGNPDTATEDLNAAVRKAGLAIKQKAQDIRSWKDNFELEMEAAITKAAQNHFKILDSIRDLAMQKIGMKWAWMDGVTYKDWAKYHELKDRFSQWMDDLKQLITTHPGLDETREASGEVEDSGMAAAQAAAKELARIKQVGLLKLSIGDSSDNFDSSTVQAAVDAAAKVSQEAAAATSTPEEDPLESAANVIEDESPAMDLPSADSVVGDAKGSIGSVADSATKIVEDFASAASDTVVSVLNEGSSLVQGSPLASATSLASVPAEHAVPTQDLASTVIAGEDQSIVVNNTGTSPATDNEANDVTPEEQLEEEIISASAEDTPVSKETASIKPVFLGAAAQSVPSRQPILDGYPEVESISAKAQEAYSNAVSEASDKYSAAMSAVSAQIYGTPKPVHEEMFSSVSSGYAAAVAAASSQLSEALSAAQGIYATPTAPAVPTFVDWAHVESIASQRLNEGRAWAEEQYASAKIALGLATATPTATAEKLLEQARYNYYAGLGVAHARYSDFISAASSAISSVTATPTPTDLAGTASSFASVATESVASAASVASDSASSAAAAVGDSVSYAASAVSESVSSAAADASEQAIAAANAAGETVSDSWDAMLSHVSLQIYGAPTPTPWYENAYSAVGDYASTATAAVGDSAQALSGVAGGYAASASEEAAKQYEIVRSIISELIVGKEPTFSESVLSRLQAAYATGASSASSYISEATAAAGSAAAAGTDTVQSVVSQAVDNAQGAGEKVLGAASAATDAVKETAQRVRDEL